MAFTVGVSDVMTLNAVLVCRRGLVQSGTTLTMQPTLEEVEKSWAHSRCGEVEFDISGSRDIVSVCVCLSVTSATSHKVLVFVWVDGRPNCERGNTVDPTTHACVCVHMCVCGGGGGSLRASLSVTRIIVPHLSRLYIVCLDQ